MLRDVAVTGEPEDLIEPLNGEGQYLEQILCALFL